METMTWSERNKVLCNATILEIWSCQKALNNRGSLLVYVFKGRRYRTDRWVKTTAAELAQDNWEKEHRHACKVG